MFALDLHLLTQNWLAYRGAVYLALALLPLALLLGWWRLRQGRPLPATVAELGMVCGTVPWLWLGVRADPDAPGRVILTPFADLTQLAAGGGTYFLIQVVANLLVFAPLGCFLPVRFPSFAALWKVLAAGALASLALEVTQLVAVSGRTFSVDDILLNATGAALAALCSRPWWAARQRGQGLPG